MTEKKTNLTVKLIKKPVRGGPIDDRIVFTATQDQSNKIDEIKARRKSWDINAMFRDVADQIIELDQQSDLEAG